MEHSPFNGKSAGVGPDLSRSAAKPAGEILKAIVLPNEFVSQGGQLFEMATEEGENLQIVLAGETSSRLKIYDVSSSPPVLRSIKKEQIQRLEPRNRSAMPQTYSQHYTLQQLLDIVSFLKTETAGPPVHVLFEDLF